MKVEPINQLVKERKKRKWNVAVTKHRTFNYD